MRQTQYFYPILNNCFILKLLLRLTFIITILIVPGFFALAQNSPDQKGIQISLLTCGAGPEIYSVFGHTAIRIVDSSKGTDIVYNYGTFDGYDQDFEKKFMQGKLLYYLSDELYTDFVGLYREDGRWVEEQVLNTGPAEKKQVQDFLLQNLLPENRAYKYDFFFDNCATRIRDLFTRVHGTAFQYPNVLPAGGPLSFRDIINRYLAHNPWERFGVNILLGSKIDRQMSNAEIMFLPDYLRDGVAGATLNGKSFAQPVKKIVAERPEMKTIDYSLSLVLYGLLLLLAAGLFVPRLRFLGLVFADFILLVTGLLGVLILVMWLGTDHQTCSDNYNLLWALPTNLMFLFRKKQYKYALIAIGLIFVALVLHLLHIQCLLLPEMMPLLLMLILIYTTSYKRYKTIQNAKDTVTA